MTKIGEKKTKLTVGRSCQGFLQDFTLESLLLPNSYPLCGHTAICRPEDEFQQKKIVCGKHCQNFAFQYFVKWPTCCKCIAKDLYRLIVVLVNTKKGPSLRKKQVWLLSLQLVFLPDLFSDHCKMMARKQVTCVSGLGTEGMKQSFIVTESKNTCSVKSHLFMTSSLLVRVGKLHTERSRDYSSKCKRRKGTTEEKGLFKLKGNLCTTTKGK